MQLDFLLAPRFRLQPCSAAFAASPPFCFEHVVRIEAGPEWVFQLVAGLLPDVGESWFPDFRRFSWLGSDSPGVGSVRRYELTYLTLVEHFTVWDPGRRLSFWVSAMSLPLARRFLEEYEMEPLAGGATELRWRVCYEPNPWVSPLHPWVRPFFSRDFQRAARNLAECSPRAPPVPLDT